jgi:hypothetical protein
MPAEKSMARPDVPAGLISGRSKMKIVKYAAMAAAVTLSSAGIADAAEFDLRIQTHFSAESLNGKNAAQFVDDVSTAI